MFTIQINNISKAFNGIKAVQPMDLQISGGQVFGFLGPNGAGKTTMVKLLNGMLTPDTGSASILGISPQERPVDIHANCGILTEHAMMYNQMTGLENLLFFGEVFGVTKSDTQQRAIDLLTRLDLMDAKDKKLGTYSTGMRQRLSLARALIHRPKVLFLDEPTSGLDPESAKSVNELIQNLAQKEGTTVFLCTHQLRYAQEICTNYGLISKGHLLASGDLQSLRDLVFGGYIVHMKTSVFPKNINHQTTNDGMIELRLDQEDRIAAIIKEIVAMGGDITHVSSRKLSLEEIYFALMKKGGISHA